ncbi:MAG: [FeFe] hydrogenase H-cluster maturation GTPase HydF [Prevotella sp.]|jgi:[FeFe] hydrogenase H-cluster maturation GTPase HydF|nr:[FeFe] hydrogenase H-cluster maturation GTPase HydF [Prevotella sp.]MCI1282730.1 [FeFe] hydrogenase H-cluster maturation GTPase HydF [Prevotella sp.]
MNETTPQSNRLHIILIGKRNSGKSSLMNALTGQQVAIVSDVPGTTTDPVVKAMEIHGIGPCVFIDTAGIDDIGGLGGQRVEKTMKALQKADIALLVCEAGQGDVLSTWSAKLEAMKIPVVPILNKVDLLADVEGEAVSLERQCGIRPIMVSTKLKQGIDRVRQAIIKVLPEDFDAPLITGNLVGDSDLVLLVMPQDIQAPKGRLILPQVQTLRELLDKKCVVMSCTTDRLAITLKMLSRPPKLIITDSQAFKTVNELKPAESLLTSFSVLFAAYKGDIDYFAESAKAIDRLHSDSKVLIAEACTHVPLAEDIGRVKIPRLLRKRIGDSLQIDLVSGNDFPEDLSGYDLIIHCGACMFNRKYVLHRVEQASRQGVPMTNYGIAIAWMLGISPTLPVPMKE